MSDTRTDIIDALTTTSERRTSARTGRMFTVILLVLFFAVMLAALVSGVSVYQSVASIQNDSSQNRLGLGIITNCARSNDSADALAVGKGPEGDSLVFVERLDSGTYETRIYLYEGKVLQEYSLEDAQYSPEKAVELADTSTFEFEYEDGLLAITTDQGTAYVALRCSQGGE